jgi:hypothetical protein
MLAIEQRGREDIFEAAGRLDAAGVKRARDARNRALAEQDERAEEENERNEERLQDVRENLSDERREILDNYNERRGDLIAAFNAERQVIQQQYQAELNTATQAYNAEAQLLNQYTQQKLRMQSAAQQAEMANKNAGYTAMVQGAQRFASALSSIARNISTPTKSFTPTPVSSFGTKPSNNITGSGSFGGMTKPTVSGSLSIGKVSKFADGGVANFAGNGEALAFVRNKERVLTPQQTSSFDKLVSMLNSGQGNGSPINADSINIDISGIDSLENIFETVARQVLANHYKRQIAGANT